MANQQSSVAALVQKNRVALTLFAVFFVPVLIHFVGWVKMVALSVPCLILLGLFAAERGLDKID